MDKNLTKHNNLIDILRGIAILMVFFVHYGQSFDNPYFTRFGQMGCQIFFFVSGYACSYSLLKCNKKIDFYKKRLKSLMPAFYTMFIILVGTNVIRTLFFNSSFIMKNISPISVICNLLLINDILPFCQNNVFFGGWFISTICILYFLHPYIDLIYKKIKDTWVITIIGIVLFSFATIIINLIIEKNIIVSNNSFEYFLFTNQIGCYLIGINMFYLERNSKLLNKYLCVLLSVLFLFLSVYYFYNFKTISFVLVPQTTALFACFLFMPLKNLSFNNKLLNVLSEIGKSSLYIYLTHWFVVMPFITILRKILNHIGINNYTLEFWIMIIPSFVMLFILVFLFKKLVMFENKILKIRK